MDIESARLVIGVKRVVFSGEFRRVGPAYRRGELTPRLV